MVNVVTRDTDELLGTWVFNDSISGLPNSWIPEHQEYVLDFISDEVSYSKIAFGNKAFKYLNDSVSVDPYNTFNGWSKPAYKTIKIIDTSSLTNREEFTTWLKANATKQSNGGDTIMSKTLNTRIKLKYDTFENWNSNNPVLLAGELGIVYVPAEQQDNLQTTKPAILFKVGDGKTHFNDLPWASALAADVYAWAKAANKPTYTAGEVGAAAKSHTHVKADITDFPTKLSDFINDLVSDDTNTTYQIVSNGANGYKLQSKEKGGDWQDVSGSVIDLSSYDTRLTAAEGEIDALQGTVSGNSGKIATLVGGDSGKSARTIASEEVAKIVAGADESYDTLKEIADWISSHGESASAMNSQITANKEAIATIQGDITGIKNGTTLVGNAAKLNGKSDADFASAGALTTIQGYFTEGKANTAVNAEQLGGHGASYFATADNLNAATQRIGTLESKKYVYEDDELILDCGTSSGL